MAEDIAQFGIDEKRQIVYASLLKYSSEAANLRDRVLDRVVLGALVGSTEAKPFQTRQIQENLHFLKNGPTIREHAIHDALMRLEADRKVRRDERQIGKSKFKTRSVFWLSNAGSDELNQTLSGTAHLFDAAFREILQNTEHHFPPTQGALLCRRVLLHCFAKIGRDLARSVTDQKGGDGSFNKTRVIEIIGEALSVASISPEAKETLIVRICEFFRSRTPAATQLKFHLTQGFYFTELLGLETARFNPLAVHSFRGSTFYLDANVLLLSIFERDRSEQAFGEIVQIAKRIGIRLVVTRATLNEIKRSASDHVQQIRKFINVLPDELIERTDDAFVLSYTRLAQKDPLLTPDKFLSYFIDLEKPLRNEWKIELDERDEDAILGASEEEDLERVINEESDASKVRRKTPRVLRHDVCHCVLISKERTKHANTWFLTQDRILTRAARRFYPTGSPPCFSTAAFLHSISPFVTASDEKPLADILNEIYELQLAPNGVVYEANELAVIAELHSDVLGTPKDQLLLAFDYVKQHELKGEPLTVDHHTKVALGLKKFLAKTRDEQLRAAEQEHIRLRHEVDAARQRHAEATQTATTKENELAGLRGRLDSAEQTNRALQQQLEQTVGSSIPIRDLYRSGFVGFVGLIAVLLAIFRSRWLEPILDRSNPANELIRTVADMALMIAIAYAFATQIKLLIHQASLRSALIKGGCVAIILAFSIGRGLDLKQANEFFKLLAEVAGLVLLLVRTS